MTPPLIKRARSARRHSALHRRRLLAESLETRQLLAADMEAINQDSPASLLPLTTMAEGEMGSLAPVAAEQAGSFADGLRQAVSEISRVVGAIGDAPELIREIPYLGDRLPADVGNTVVIDTSTIASVFRLGERFQTEVAEPLDSFLQSNPTATAEQLIGEFPFLTGVPGIGGDVSGVRLNFDLADQLDSSLAALLEPITGGVGGLIDAVDGAALATGLPFDLSLEGLSFDILQQIEGEVERLGISIPDFSLGLSRDGDLPVDFAANVGFLSGFVEDASIDFDFDFLVSAGSVFNDSTLSGTPLDGLIALDNLSELSVSDIAEAIRVAVGGEGLNVELPFDFDLAGFDTGGFLPVFTLSDLNPLDGQFPDFGLSVPAGAPYSPEALLGFHSIDATSILTSLEQLGSVFFGLEEGELLDFPVPLGDGVTLGEVVGLGETFGGAVLPFLRDDEGLPAFGSINQLITLIPGAEDVLSYNPETQILTVSLDIFELDPDPIETQAALDLVAGAPGSPIFSVEATGGEFGLDNRLTINRSVDVGLELQIDLSEQPDQPLAPELEEVSDRLDRDVLGSVPVRTILERLGLGNQVENPPPLQIRLANDLVDTINFGPADEFTSLAEWLARGNNSSVRFEFESSQANPEVFEQNRFVIIDISIFRGGQTEVLNTDSFWTTLLAGGQEVITNGFPVLSSGLLNRVEANTNDTPLETFFPESAGAGTDLTRPSDPLIVNFLDGTTETIDLGPVLGRTVGSLVDGLNVIRGGEFILRAERLFDRIVLTDVTTPVPGERFSIEFDDNGGSRLLERFVQESSAPGGENEIRLDRFITELPYDLAPPIDQTTTLGSILEGTIHEDLLGTESTASVLPPFSSTPFSISTGVIEAETTIGELVSRLTVSSDDDGSIQLLAELVDDRIELRFLSNNAESVQITDTTADGPGLFQALFLDHLLGAAPLGGFARTFSDSLANLEGSRLQRPQAPPILVNLDQPVSLRTTVDTILQRSDIQSSQTQNATVVLRDATEIPLIARPGQTIHDLLVQNQFYRDDELIAQLEFADNRLTLRDFTTGSETLRLSGMSDVFWIFAVAGAASSSDPDVLTGSPLSTTVLQTGGTPTLEDFFSADDPRLGEQGAEIFLSLPNGTMSSFSVGTPRDTELRDLLEGLTIRRDGELLTRARVVNERIEVRYVGESNEAVDQPFSIELRGIFDGSQFAPASPWPAAFVPIGETFLDRLEGRPLVPQLASSSAAVRGDSLVADLLAARASATLVDDSTEQTALALLRDGTQVTINAGTLDTDLPLSELIERLTVTRGEDDQGQPRVVVSAELQDDSLVLIDHTTGDDRFRLSTPSSSLFIELFSSGVDVDVFGLVERFATDRAADGRIVSGSLTAPQILATTPLQAVLGDDPETFALSSEASTTEDFFLSGLTADGSSDGTFFSIPPLTPQTTPAEIAEALTINDPGLGLNLSTEFVDGRFVITNLSPVNQDSAVFQVLTTSRQPLIARWFGNLIDIDRDGRVTSAPLFTPGISTRIDASTMLGDYLRSIGSEEFIEGPSTTSINVTLRDGTSETLVVRAADSLTLAAYASQFRIERDGEVIFNAELEQLPGLGGDFRYRFVLTDRTVAEGGSNEFSVTVDTETVTPGALIPLVLGLVGVDQSDAGSITGGTLGSGTGDEEQRFRIAISDPTLLRAEITAVASNLNAEVRIGEVLAAGVQNGSGMASASIELVFNSPAGRPFVTLDDLTAAATGSAPLFGVVIDADAQVGGEVFVDLGGLNDTIDDPSQRPRFDLIATDIITTEPNLRLDTSGFVFTTDNFENLVQFPSLTLENLTELIRRGIVFVERLAGPNLLARDLPLVNTSLGEILNTVEAVTIFADEFDFVEEANPTLDRLEADVEAALNLQPDEFELVFDPETNTIRTELNLSIASGPLVDPDDPDGPRVPLVTEFNLDLADAVGLPEAFDGFVDFSGEGRIELDAEAELRIHLGLDLGDLASGEFDDAVVVFDTSGVFAGARVEAEDLRFNANLLPAIGGTVGPGQIVVDRDGIGGGDEPVSISITPIEANFPDGRLPLSQVGPDDFTFEFIDEIVVDADLPILLAGSDTPEPFQLQLDDPLNLGSLQQVNTISGPGNQIVLPDLSAAVQNVVDNFNLADGIVALASGLQALFSQIDDRLGDGDLLGIPVPIIGDALADAVQFVDNFVGPLSERLEGGIDPDALVIEAARELIFQALGPGPGGGGLNVLRDLDGDGSLTALDVADLVLPGASAASTTSGGEGEDVQNELGFQISIGRDAINASTDINLDVGGSAVGLQLEGEASITAGYTLDLGIGFNLTDGVFIQFGDGTDISLGFEAALDSLEGGARLGPLGITAANIPADQLSDEQRRRARLVPEDESTEAINAVLGNFAIDFPTGRFTLDNLDQLFSGIDVGVDFVGSLATRFSVDTTGGLEGLPTISGDFLLNFEPVVAGTPAELIESLSRPMPSVNNAALDLGAFLSDIIVPVIEPVNEFLDPIRPTLETLTSPIPVVSDL